MSLRPAVLLAALAAVPMGGSAFAGGPQRVSFTDPAKDNRSATASGDITSVTFTTSGPGTGRAYTPKNLVVTLGLAAPPGTDGTTQYQVGWSIAGCEYYMQFAPGARVSPDFGFADCGSEPDATGDAGTSFGFLAQPKGNTLEFKVAIKELPNKVKLGAAFTDLYAWADFVEPAGFFGPASFGEPLYDTASSTKVFRLG